MALKLELYFYKLPYKIMEIAKLSVWGASRGRIRIRGASESLGENRLWLLPNALATSPRRPQPYARISRDTTIWIRPQALNYGQEICASTVLILYSEVLQLHAVVLT